MSKSSDLDELSMLIDVDVLYMFFCNSAMKPPIQRRLSGAFGRSLESLMLLLWRHQGV